MSRISRILLSFLFLFAAASSPSAAPLEKRLALVIGNASYKAKPLKTTVNDAALIAQTLQAAGFSVMGVRDPDGGLLRQTFRDFVDNVAKAGPDVVAVVYFAGYGLQFEGENYLVPIDANIGEASDVPLRALRLSEQTQALAALHLKTTFIILDAARASPFVMSGQPPAGGLAWVEPETNSLIAFNAAPGSVAQEGGDGYGPYAKALAEMIRQGGLSPGNLFDRVRLRVSELTKGTQVPWDALNNETQFVFFERGPGAPPRADSAEHAAWMRSQPMRSLGAHDAYTVALMRDTFDAYADFLAEYRHDPMTKRVRALLAARREAITWQRTYQANIPAAYWSYLKRYPRGPHMADARRVLTRLGAAITPPSKFAAMEYDVPPPLPNELEYIERTVLAFDDPAFEPPPPPSGYLLQPPPPELLAMEAPAASSGAHTLPVPAVVPLPVYIGVPADIAPPNSGNALTLANTAPIDVPTNAVGHAVSSSIPSTGSADNRSSPAPAVNPVTSEEIKARPSLPVPMVPLTPLTPTDSNPPAAWGIGPPALATSNEAPTPAPAMLAPPPTYRSGRLALRTPLPIPRPVTLVPPASGLPLRSPRAAALSPQTTGSNPLPAARPGVPAPTPARNRPKPIPPAANQAKQPATPVRNTPAPGPPLERDPEVEGGVSPPAAEENPCRPVDGRLVCN